MPDSFGGNKLTVLLTDVLPAEAIAKLLKGEKIAMMVSLQMEKSKAAPTGAAAPSQTVKPFGWTWTG